MQSGFLRGNDDAEAKVMGVGGACTVERKRGGGCVVDDYTNMRWGRQSYDQGAWDVAMVSSDAHVMYLIE